MISHYECMRIIVRDMYMVADGSKVECHNKTCTSYFIPPCTNFYNSVNDSFFIPLPAP